MSDTEVHEARLENVATAIYEGSFCSSREEADVIAEIVLCDLDDNNLAQALVVHLEVTADQASKLVASIRAEEPENSSDGGRASKGMDSFSSDENDYDAPDGETGDEDDILLAPGECEMCDRYMKLTRHHLIPKSTWPRLQKLLLSAALAKEKGEVEKAMTKLGHGLEDRFDLLVNDKSCIRGIVQTTCDICRQCHNAVHKAHPNIDLALHYNSVDKLLEDEQIARFCKWASKQRPRNRGMS